MPVARSIGAAAPLAVVLIGDTCGCSERRPSIRSGIRYENNPTYLQRGSSEGETAEKAHRTVSLVWYDHRRLLGLSKTLCACPPSSSGTTAVTPCRSLRAHDVGLGVV